MKGDHDNHQRRLLQLTLIYDIHVKDGIVCYLAKLFLLGTSNVARMAFIDFLIDTSSNNDGARGASSYFK